MWPLNAPILHLGPFLASRYSILHPVNSHRQFGIAPGSEMRKILFVTLIVFQGFATTAIAQEKFGFEAGVYGGAADWRDRTFR